MGIGNQELGNQANFPRAHGQRRQILYRPAILQLTGFPFFLAYGLESLRRIVNEA